MTETIVYAQRPKPYSAELELSLEGSRLVAVRGRSRQEFPLAAIERITLSFTPKNSARRAFACRVQATDGRWVQFDNLSWKSLIEVERQNGPYDRIVRGLIARVAAANPSLALVGGIARWRHTVMSALGLAMLAALLGAAIYAATSGSWPLGLAALGLVAYLGFWLREFLGRNRPRRFTADSVPADLLP